MYLITPSVLVFVNSVQIGEIIIRDKRTGLSSVLLALKIVAKLFTNDADAGTTAGLDNLY